MTNLPASDAAAAAEAETGDRAGIQSVELGAAILRALAGGGGLLPLRDIAAATGMHRGKVHRYLISLTRSGLVVQDPRTGHYGIGPLTISAGLVGLSRLAPLRLVQDAMPGLRDQVGETVALAIWGEMGATVVGLEESARPVTLNVRVGSVLPLRDSAIGRMFAALLPDSATAPVLAAETARRGEAATDVSGDDWPALLADIRARGLSRVEGTLIPGLNALAAPVFDHRGQIVAVVGLVGHRESLDTGWSAAPAQQLAAATAALSEQLGYPVAAG